MIMIKDKNGYVYAKENLGKSKKHEGKYDIAITPLNPDTGEKITKKELYGKNSNQSAIFHIYAKNETEALELDFPKLAEETIVPAMIAAGIVDMPEELDLKELFLYYKEEIFEYCRSQSIKRWKESTIKGYMGQYELMLNDLAGIYPEKMNTDLYCYIQGCICQSATSTSNDGKKWVQYGDEAPASAQKRLNFLYHGLIYLESKNLIELHFIPFKYNGAPSREDELKQLLGKPRSYPAAVCQEFVNVFREDELSSLIAACGMRISEAAGLLECSICSVDTSQGVMWYLAIFGQLDSRGKYNEYGKSSAAYRCVPIPCELAQKIVRQIDAKTGGNTDADILMLSALLNEAETTNSPKHALAAKEKVETDVCSFLRNPGVQEQLYQQIPFVYDEALQKKELEAASTVHSLRRNFCSWLHCYSGIDYDQIFYQMGHSQGKNAPRQRGKSTEELQKMCLRELVSESMFHPQKPLCYSVDEKWKEMDVPACKLVLDIPAGWEGDIIVTSTEPENDIQITPSHPENIKVKLQSVSVPYPMTDALLASEDSMKIVSIEQAFE